MIFTPFSCENDSSPVEKRAKCFQNYNVKSHGSMRSTTMEQKEEREEDMGGVMYQNVFFDYKMCNKVWEGGKSVFGRHVFVYNHENNWPNKMLFFVHYS